MALSPYTSKLKGNPIFEETDYGAHYYAFSPALSTTKYTEAFANIVLPTSMQNTPSGVSTQYDKRNAFISLGIWGDEGGVDLGIRCMDGKLWMPVSLDTAGSDRDKFQEYSDCYSYDNSTNAIIVVKPVSRTCVRMFLQFVNAAGNPAGSKTFEKDIPVVSRRNWSKYYRFASLVQYPQGMPDVRTDSTYMLGGKFTNLGLYDSTVRAYRQWGMFATENLIKDAWIMHKPKCQVSTTNNSDSFTIDHWA